MDRLGVGVSSNCRAVGINQTDGAEAAAKKIFRREGESLTKDIATLRNKSKIAGKDVGVSRFQTHGRVNGDPDRAECARLLNRRRGVAKKTNIQLRGFFGCEWRNKACLHMTGAWNFGHDRQCALAFKGFSFGRIQDAMM